MGHMPSNFWLGLRCFWSKQCLSVLGLVKCLSSLSLRDGCGFLYGKNLDPVLDTLTRTGIDAEAFRCFAALPGILSDLGVPAPIVRLLRDIHLGT